MSAAQTTSASDPKSPPRALPLVSVLVIALALIVAGLPSFAPALLYERAAILTHGQWWRLWTGHFVHFGTGHLFWNLLVFAIAGIWVERIAPARTRLLLLIAPGVISLVLLALDPALQTYGGLSGVVVAALALLAFTQLGQKPADRWFWLCLLALIVVKIAFEFAADRTVFARFVGGVRPVPLAHLAGVLVASTLHRTRRRPPA